MEQVFNYFNQSNEERGDAFMAKGSKPLALKFYLRALKDLQKDPVVSEHQERNVDRLQRKIMACKFELRSSF